MLNYLYYALLVWIFSLSFIYNIKANSAKADNDLSLYDKKKINK